MTPEEIEGHARNVRRKLNRIYDNSSYKSFGPVKDIFAVADDLCELVIALAENAKAEVAPAPPPSVTVTVEQPFAKETKDG
jgi:hypothetical protein